MRTYLKFEREELSVDHPEDMGREIAHGLVRALYQSVEAGGLVSDPSSVPGGPGSLAFRMAVKTFQVAGRSYEVLLENDRCTIREV